jgi:hypothetical protein
MVAACAAARTEIGSEVFTAEWRFDLAAESCRRVQTLLPYYRDLIHARWSGEAPWSPLAGV